MENSGTNIFYFCLVGWNTRRVCNNEMDSPQNKAQALYDRLAADFHLATFAGVCAVALKTGMEKSIRIVLPETATEQEYSL